MDIANQDREHYLSKGTITVIQHNINLASEHKKKSKLELKERKIRHSNNPPTHLIDKFCNSENLIGDLAADSAIAESSAGDQRERKTQRTKRE